jgi:pSer/pThr/pTyr-binding forkhead associated (FHA) protein
MVDPRLNSVHLEAPRRQEFRRAREALLEARGWQTVMAEKGIEEPVDGPHTIVQVPAEADNKGGPAEIVGLPANCKFWLVDRDFVYPLKVGLNTVGRAPDNDVVIQDAYVSRRHCAILVHSNLRAELHDVASKNGTFLNGRKLAGPTQLHTGDEIRMCDRQVVFLCKTSEGDPPADVPTLMA